MKKTDQEIIEDQSELAVRKNSDLFDPGCDLCTMDTTNLGKDTIIYQDGYCYIVENGNTHLSENGKLVFAKKRFSFTLKDHRNHLEGEELENVYDMLRSVLKIKFDLEPERDYFIRTTMGSYPDHFHTHAYVPPFSDEGEIIDINDLRKNSALYHPPDKKIYSVENPVIKYSLRELIDESGQMAMCA